MTAKLVLKSDPIYEVIFFKGTPLIHPAVFVRLSA